MPFLLRVHARNANEMTHRKQAPELQPGSAGVSPACFEKEATHQLAGGTPALPGLHGANSTLFQFHFAFARREFKRDLALVVHHEIRRKRFPGLGDELVEQIGLVRGQQFLRLRRLNRLLQNFPVDLEFARAGRPPATSRKDNPPPCQKSFRRTSDICPAVPCR